MNQAEQQIEEVSITIDQAKDFIELADAMNRLHSNADFKKVILDGFFKAEASRAVLLRGEPAMQTDERQKDIDNIITSIGGLYQYIHKVFSMGEMAKRDLNEHENTREELLQEQLSFEETVQ